MTFEELVAENQRLEEIVLAAAARVADLTRAGDELRLEVADMTNRLREAKRPRILHDGAGDPMARPYDGR